MTTRDFLFPLLILLLSINGCSANITQIEAENAVKAFENNNNLAFSRIELENSNLNPVITRHKDYYNLFCSSLNADYWVNATTGTLAMVVYHDRFVNPQEDSEPVGTYTKEQCRSAAETYARSKYADFDQLGFTLYSEDWFECTWDFEWRRSLDYGVVPGDYVQISIDPWSCQVARYSSEKLITPSPQQAPISSNDAIADAITAVNIVSVTYSYCPPHPYIDTQGQMTYLVRLKGTRADNRAVSAVVAINAANGETRDISYAFSSSSNSFLPPKKSSAPINNSTKPNTKDNVKKAPNNAKKPKQTTGKLL